MYGDTAICAAVYLRCQRHLSIEPQVLLLWRGKLWTIVEATLSNSKDLGQLCVFANFCEECFRERCSTGPFLTREAPVGMYPCARQNNARKTFCYVKHASEVTHARARQNKLFHVHGVRCCDVLLGVAVRVQEFAEEIGVDIDEVVVSKFFVVTGPRHSFCRCGCRRCSGVTSPRKPCVALGNTVGARQRATEPRKRCVAGGPHAPLHE